MMVVNSLRGSALRAVERSGEARQRRTAQRNRPKGEMRFPPLPQFWLDIALAAASIQRVHRAGRRPPGSVSTKRPIR